MQPRFQTNPGKGGVEKISISAMRKEFGMEPRFLPDAAAVSAEAEGLLPPHQLIYVKGWSRSLAFLTVCRCCFENETFLEARP